MVGRLVEQHHVGFADQHARQGGAARLAAGQFGGHPAAVELHLLEDGGDPVVVRPQRIGERPGHVVADRGVSGKVRLLRQGGDGGAGLGKALACVEDRLAREDAQQGRLAGAIAADQRQALARRDAEVDAVEDRLVAEMEADAGEGKEGWVSHRYSQARGCSRSGRVS